MLASKQTQKNWKKVKEYGDLIELSTLVGLEKTGLSQVLNGKRGTKRANLAKIDKWLEKRIESIK